jgi:hypothetical protein
MSLPPEFSPTWRSIVERGSSPVGGSAWVAQGSVSDFSASLHNVITQSRENPGPLHRPELHRWQLQIVFGNCQNPCACGTELSYGTFNSSIGGSREKPPKFLQAQWLWDSALHAYHHPWRPQVAISNLRQQVYRQDFAHICGLECCQEEQTAVPH